MNRYHLLFALGLLVVLTTGEVTKVFGQGTPPPTVPPPTNPPPTGPIQDDPAGVTQIPNGTRTVIYNGNTKEIIDNTVVVTHNFQNGIETSTTDVRVLFRVTYIWNWQSRIWIKMTSSRQSMICTDFAGHEEGTRILHGFSADTTNSIYNEEFDEFTSGSRWSQRSMFVDGAPALALDPFNMTEDYTDYIADYAMDTESPKVRRGSDNLIWFARSTREATLWDYNNPWAGQSLVAEETWSTIGVAATYNWYKIIINGLTDYEGPWPRIIN